MDGNTCIEGVLIQTAVKLASVRNTEKRLSSFDLPSCHDGELSLHILDNS